MTIQPRTWTQIRAFRKMQKGFNIWQEIKMLLLVFLALMTLSCDSQMDTAQGKHKSDVELVRDFWTAFKQTVKSGSDAEIASHISINRAPMSEEYTSLESLILDFDWLFPAEARKAIIGSRFEQLAYYGEGSPTYWEFFWTNWLDSEGQHSVTYRIGFVGEKPMVTVVFATG